MTLQQLAKEAIAVQNAVNLSGVSISFTAHIRHMRDIATREGHDWRWVDTHPITILWLDKIASLCGCTLDSTPPMSEIYKTVDEMTK